MRIYDHGKTVALTAIPDAGSQFAGWLGDCTGRGQCTVTMTRAVSVSAMFAPDTTPLTVDIDGNGKYEPLGDGMLVARYLYGVTGDSLFTGAATGGGAALLDRLSDVWPILDIDGNGQPDALTDAILLMRYLFGLRGSMLLTGGVGTGATRTTAVEIEAYIHGLMP